MYKYVTRWLCVIALIVPAGMAHAVFHLWQLNEIYSNADGTVQFIELTTSAAGQEFLAGHTITSSQGVTTSSFTFASDLPGYSADPGYSAYSAGTAGKTFLIGTTGFAALGLVTPDYIVPNGFLFTSNGSVNFAGVDSVSWTALPVDGVTSINRFGATAINSPKNFAGVTAAIPVGGGITPASLATNYSDWWADPSYGGASLNISQQGNALGLAWYFYDTAGTPTWIFGGGDLSGATASVTLLRATGVTLGSPASVTGVPIGTATITFTSDSAATFAFTYSGTSAYLGRSGQLSLQRYTLAPLPIAGTYRYAAKIVNSGCSLPANNGTDYPFGTLVITATSGTITVRNTVLTGNVCDYSGTYVQNGSKLSSGGTFTCTNGTRATGHFDYGFTNDSIQITETTQQTAGGDTCQSSVWRNGVRQ